MRRQLVPGPVVRLTVIKAKTRPGIEARFTRERSLTIDLIIEIRFLIIIFDNRLLKFNNQFLIIDF